MVCGSCCCSVAAAVVASVAAAVVVAMQGVFQQYLIHDVAGGFDAMFALYVCTDPGTADEVDPVRRRLETCWAEWREMDVQMLLSGAGAHGISVSW